MVRIPSPVIGHFMRSRSQRVTHSPCAGLGLLIGAWAAFYACAIALHMGAAGLMAMVH